MKLCILFITTTTSENIHPLDYSTPFAHLKQQNPDVNDNIRFFQPFILDDVSVKLGPWSGYNLLAQ